MPTAELSLKRDKSKQFNFETEFLLNDNVELMEINDKTTNTSNSNEEKDTNLKLELESEQDSYEDDDELEENCEFFVSELLERPKETGANTYTVKDNQITFVSGVNSDGNNNSNQDMVILFLTE